MTDCCPTCGRLKAAERGRFRQTRQRIAEIQHAYNEMLMSQREVAKLMGCSQATVSRIVSPMT